jgi:hypothetical protein
MEFSNPNHFCGNPQQNRWSSQKQLNPIIFREIAMEQIALPILHNCRERSREPQPTPWFSRLLLSEIDVNHLDADIYP